jgi:hypothetical protein
LDIVLMIVSLARLRHAQFDWRVKRVVAAGAMGMIAGTIFNTYSVGGVRAPSFAMVVFLGLANASPWLRAQQEMPKKCMPSRRRTGRIYQLAPAQNTGGLRLQRGWVPVLSFYVMAIACGVFVALATYIVS